MIDSSVLVVSITTHYYMTVGGRGEEWSKCVWREGKGRCAQWLTVFSDTLALARRDSGCYTGLSNSLGKYLSSQIILNFH